MTLKAGRLGIGTSEPRAMLDVRGDLKVDGMLIESNKPRFSAYSTETNGTFSGFTSPVILEKTYYNVGSHYSTSSGAFTAPVSGYYRFSILLWNSGSGAQGSLWYKTSSSSATWDDIHPYKLLGLPAAGDETIISAPTGTDGTHTFELYVPRGYQIGFGGRGGQSLLVYRAHSYFSGELISEVYI